MAEKSLEAKVKTIAATEAINILKDNRYASVAPELNAVIGRATEHIKAMNPEKRKNLRAVLTAYIKRDLDDVLSKQKQQKAQQEVDLAKQEQQKAAMEAALSKAKEREYKLEWKAAGYYYAMAYTSAPEEQKPALEAKIMEMAKNCLLERKYSEARDIYSELEGQPKARDLAEKLDKLDKLDYIVERFNDGSFFTPFYNFYYLGYTSKPAGENIDSPKTVASIKELQKNLGMPQTGELDDGTIVALAKKVESDRNKILADLDKELNIKPAVREALVFINTKQREINELRKKKEEGDRFLEVGLQKIAQARTQVTSDPEGAMRIADDAFKLVKAAKKTKAVG